MAKAHARTLTTAELGAMRYESAKQSDTWPVCVTFGASPHDTQSTTVTLVTTERQFAFERMQTGDWYVTDAWKAGERGYEVFRDGTPVCSGVLDVQVADAPLSAGGLASKLTSRRPSGARQMGRVVGADGGVKWGVRFVYAEEGWMGREVYVVSEGLEEDVKMDRVEGGWYEGEGGVSAGVVQYRFRVVPREYTRAQVAPFTRLGWDERLCGREGLVTWPLKIDVKDLGRGERGGEEFVEWDKSGKEEAEVCEPAAKGEGGFGMACAAVLVVIVGIVARVVVSMGGKGEDLAEDLVEGEDEKEKIESVKDSVVSVSPSAQRSQQVGMDEILRHALGSSG